MDMAKPMCQGIYILGNDRIIDDAIALLHSLRRFAPDLPVRLIPFDDHHQRLARILHRRFSVELYQDKELFRELADYAIAIRGKDAPAFRKFACWFGPFQEFIYFDTDIVVLQDQRDVFDLLSDHDIVYCGSGRQMGIREVFTERIYDRRLFSDLELQDLFNTGFFASRRGVLERRQLLKCLSEAQTVSDIFVPHNQDQPILNYVVLKTMPKRANLRELAPTVHPDAWAGKSNLRVIGDTLLVESVETVTPARHLHWASFHRLADRPYVDLWLAYRYPGILGPIQRLLRRVAWFASKSTCRVLTTDTPGWYRPRFQIKRIQRILKRRLGNSLQE